jgi:hypothetical protein
LTTLEKRSEFSDIEVFSEKKVSNLRKRKRSDRNHCIYIITCTFTDEKYVGITAAIGRAFQKSVKIRFAKHCSRAKCEQKTWNLYKKIQEYGIENFKCELHEVVRGKKEAHKKETEMIRTGQFVMNTHGV